MVFDVQQEVLGGTNHLHSCDVAQAAYMYAS